ncbi:MAG: ZIP family metal transporter [Gemmatimonadota bacterium]
MTHYLARRVDAGLRIRKDDVVLWAWFTALSPLAQGLLAGAATWTATAAGAALVFAHRNPSHALLDTMLGFAAGVMVAASIWSLLVPSIRLSSAAGGGWMETALGLAIGVVFLRVADLLGIHTSWKRSTLLVLAVTLHHIPEGLAMGVAFGAAGLPGGVRAGATVSAAAVLTLGLLLQNIPEGVAVALPLRREGISAARSFWYGQASAAVEPLAAAAGVAAILVIRPLLPYALAFAAGAMLYVVFDEMLPETRRSGHGELATTLAIVGFALMTALDAFLG